MTTSIVNYGDPGTPVANLTVSQSVASVSSYIATNSITFAPGFTSAPGDNFTAYISTTSTVSGTNSVTTYNNPISSANLSNPADLHTILKYQFYDDYTFATAKPFNTGFTNTSYL